MQINNIASKVNINSIAGIDKINGNEEKNEITFSNMLKDAIYEVNNTQRASQKTTMDFVAGKVDDISQVVIASEKASINMQLAIQVRNKVLDAYQEVMRMQM